MATPRLDRCRKCGAPVSTDADRCPRCGCSIPFTWVEYRCRVCGGPVGSDTHTCPSCGCKTPFACSVCGEVLIHVNPGAPGLARGGANQPYGKLIQEGQLVCYRHQLIECYHCMGLFHESELQLRVTGFDRSADGKILYPREELFCSKCQALHVEPKKPGSGCLVIVVLAPTFFLIVDAILR
jgi:hypothetical protein